MGSQDQHALTLLENLRRLYETEDCFLSDVTLVARDGQVKGKDNKKLGTYKLFNGTRKICWMQKT